MGAAKIILNDELKKDNLNREIKEIIKSPELMEKMGKKALTKAVNNVQENIYNEIKKVLKGDKSC